MVRSARFAFVLLLAVSSAACAASTDDDTGSSAAALTEYDGVVAHGTKVQNDPTPNDTYSAKTRVVGYLKNTTVANAKAQILKVDKWKDMKDEDGKRIFPTAGIRNATASTVTAQVTLQGDIPLDLTLKPTTDSNGKTTIKVTNTNAYNHWLVGQVLAPGKLSLVIMLIPKDDGVIVDATLQVKLEQQEGQAAGVTATLPTVFDWLKDTVPHSNDD